MTKSDSQEINIHEAKTHLSQYVAQVREGKSFTLCKNGTPVALLSPLPAKKIQKRNIFGLAKGIIEIPDSFFEPLTDEDLPGFGLDPAKTKKKKSKVGK